MPLEEIGRVLVGDTRTIDRHVTRLIDEATRARKTAAELHTTLHPAEGNIMIEANGPILASAVDQILGATAHHPDHPVLGGVYVEASGGVMTLTATDRFRLATRTMIVGQQEPTELAAVIDGDDLRSALPTIRRQHRVEITSGDNAVLFGPGGMRCRTLSESFPDYRNMLDSLPSAVTRVVVRRSELTKAIENHQGRYLSVVVSGGAVRVSILRSNDGTEIPADVSGPDQTLAFEMTTLYPAIAPVVGPELMLDIAAPHMPVVIRSADDGDLTTLAMPIDPDGVE